MVGRLRNVRRTILFVERLTPEGRDYVLLSRAEEETFEVTFTIDPYTGAHAGRVTSVRLTTLRSVHRLLSELLRALFAGRAGPGSTFRVRVADSRALLLLSKAFEDYGLEYPLGQAPE